MPPTPRTEVLQVLLLVQAAIATTAVIEAAVVGVAAGGPPLPVLLTLLGAAATGWFVWRVARPAPTTFRWLRKLEIGWMGLAALDLALAVVLARRGLSLAATATRIGLPLWIYLSARREDPRVAV